MLGVLNGSYRHIAIVNGVLNICNCDDFEQLFNRHVESISIQYKGGIYIDSEEILKKINDINGNVSANVESYVSVFNCFFLFFVFLVILFYLFFVI